jgi:hypothetical protein
VGVFLSAVFYFQKPTPAPARHTRLVKTSSYEIANGDTLNRVAYLLYGHKSWWIKIRKQNPKFKRFSAETPLPVGKVLKYRAPKIGEEYIVKKNDWLIRIAQWKYGSSNYWHQLYTKNSGEISNPDLIHPGDRLILRLDGTIENTKTGQVIVKGVGGNLAGVGGNGTGAAGTNTSGPGGVSTTGSAAGMANRQPANTPPVVLEWWEDPSRLTLIAAGFALGLLALLWVHHRQSGMWAQRVGARGARRKRSSYEEDDEEDEELIRRVKARAKSDTGFKRRPLDEYRIDPNLIPTAEGFDLSELLKKVPGFHSLMPKRKKKYLKRQ